MCNRDLSWLGSQDPTWWGEMSTLSGIRKPNSCNVLHRSVCTFCFDYLINRSIINTFYWQWCRALKGCNLQKLLAFFAQKITWWLMNYQNCHSVIFAPMLVDEKAGETQVLYNNCANLLWCFVCFDWDGCDNFKNCVMLSSSFDILRSLFYNSIQWRVVHINHLILFKSWKKTPLLWKKKVFLSLRQCECSYC